MKNIIETLEASEAFKTFLELARLAKMDGNLAGEGPFTVFVPTDAAFERMDPDSMDEIRDDPDSLLLLLGYHIVPTRLSSAELRILNTVPSMLGSDLSIRTSEDGITINGVRIIEADALCTNGICHALDAVLIPPEVPVIPA